jgi:hypothetical protein
MMVLLEQKKAETCSHSLDPLLHNKFCCVWLVYLICDTRNYLKFLDHIRLGTK